MNVRILDDNDAGIEGTCAGPAWSGACPAVEPHEVVACAGRRVVVTLTDGHELTFNVGTDATACPLGALMNLYRGTGRLGSPPR